jgi:hypothetical protein
MNNYGKHYNDRPIVNRMAGANSTYPKMAVRQLNYPDSYRDLCIYQRFCLLDSEDLRSRKLTGLNIQVAAKLYLQAYRSAKT